MAGWRLAEEYSFTGVQRLYRISLLAVNLLFYCSYGISTGVQALYPVLEMVYKAFEMCWLAARYSFTGAVKMYCRRL
jgi:hypothetical protein